MSRQSLQRIGQRLLLALSILGPGIITASADNDAAGIATYSVAGSTYGYGFLWIILWVTLGEVVVQEMAARMGAVTGKGLTDLIRERYGVRLAMPVMIGLVVANLGTTTAQFAGVASASELFGVSRYLAVPLAGVAMWLIVLRGSYSSVEKAMLALTLYAIAYVASAIMVRPTWSEVLQSAFVPTLSSDRHFLLALLATIGTTMTPWGCAYLQATVADKGVSMKQYGYTRVDVISGAALGNIVSAFIVICAAATLFPRGVRVESAAQAALALEPLAGPWAKQLFAAGLLGASLLAAAVLPLATTYAVCEAFGWERGMNRLASEAPMFYGLYTAQIVIGVFVVLIPAVPLFPLMWLSQVINAALLPAVLVIMLTLANDVRIMRHWHNGHFSNLLSYVLIVLVSLATIALLIDALP